MLQVMVTATFLRGGKCDTFRSLPYFHFRRERIYIKGLIVWCGVLLLITLGAIGSKLNTCANAAHRDIGHTFNMKMRTDKTRSVSYQSHTRMQLD